MSAPEVPAGARAIQLHGKHGAGLVALVDEADYDLVSACRWTVQVSYRKPKAGLPEGQGARYAISASRRAGKVVAVLMHQLITGCKGVDHINDNGLDNRRSNLREAEPWQNIGNSRPLPGRSSRFKGVCWDKSHRKWRVSIGSGAGRRHLGMFDSETAGARAYDVAAIDRYGEFARPNFPSPRLLTTSQREAVAFLGRADSGPAATPDASERVALILGPALDAASRNEAA